MHTNELMLYKNMEYGEILQDMTFLMENYNNEYYNREDLRSLLFECINELLEISVSHGFEGNLWHTYLTFLLSNDENAYIYAGANATGNRAKDDVYGTHATFSW